MKTYRGSCHCGAVTYSVEGDIPDTAMSCNCSHCRRKGFLLAFVPIDQFRLESGADQLNSGVQELAGGVMSATDPLLAAA